MGNICADDGSLLATSIPYYCIALDPYIVDEIAFEEQLRKLSNHSLPIST